LGDFQELSATPGASNMPVGINNVSDALSIISVFPNPFSSKLKIVLHKTLDDNITIKIRNSLGKVVLERLLDNQAEASVDFESNNLADGVYFISIYMKGMPSVTKKVIFIK
jgi:hypothetical protein